MCFCVLDLVEYVWPVCGFAVWGGLCWCALHGIRRHSLLECVARLGRRFAVFVGSHPQ